MQLSIESESQVLQASGREELLDKKFVSDLSGASFTNRQFTRLVAKERRFEKVDFSYSTFDSAYLRKCKFDSCNFTGCKFLGVNFHGSTFDGCKFDYATFERTLIDPDVLRTNAPAYENLKLRFARTLRVNFQQLGDSSAVNQAIQLELRATECHLNKAWLSPESYYRQKYKGLKRAAMFGEWLHFKLLELIWGNGENTFKLCVSAIVLIVVVAIVDLFVAGTASNIYSYWDSLNRAPQLLLGVIAPAEYSKSYLAFLAFLRLVVLALFTSVIVKRLSRR